MIWLFQIWLEKLKKLKFENDWFYQFQIIAGSKFPGKTLSNK